MPLIFRFEVDEEEERLISNVGWEMKWNFLERGYEKEL